MTANINELRLRLSIRRSSSTSLRDSPCVSTLPQMAPILGVWAASQGRRRQPFRQRSAAARRPRRPRLARMRRNRVRAPGRAGCARQQRQFVGAPSRQTPHGISSGALYEPSVPRPVGTARALGGDLSLASFALGHLVVLALGRGARAPVRHATDTIKAAGDGHRSAHKPCRVWGLPTAPAAAAHHWGPALGRARAASVRRRDRTPVRSSVLASRDSSRQARATRADAVAQQKSEGRRGRRRHNKAWAGYLERP